mgnify:CR=1 FL=1
MPCEFIDLFDPHYPVIVGGLLPTEETLGFLQVRGASACGCSSPTWLTAPVTRSWGRLAGAGPAKEAPVAPAHPQERRPAHLLRRLAALPIHPDVLHQGRRTAQPHAQVHPQAHALHGHLLRYALRRETRMGGIKCSPWRVSWCRALPPHRADRAAQHRCLRLPDAGDQRGRICSRFFVGGATE